MNSTYIENFSVLEIKTIRFQGILKFNHPFYYRSNEKMHFVWSCYIVEVLPLLHVLPLLLGDPHSYFYFYPYLILHTGSLKYTDVKKNHMHREAFIIGVSTKFKYYFYLFLNRTNCYVFDEIMRVHTNKSDKKDLRIWFIVFKSYWWRKSRNCLRRHKRRFFKLNISLFLFVCAFLLFGFRYIKSSQA